ncbi:MAG: sulfatase-like hydrolase/transferase [Rikenellaceae bacterium]
MNRSLLIACGASLPLLLTSCGKPQKSRPNVLLILTDDQGWGDFGFNGNADIRTPVLDSLQSISSHLTNFYVSPLSATTRAGILTGRDHLRTGALGVTRAAENMSSDEVTLAEVLAQSGYRTGCFGKWHNGAYHPNDALGQGFEEFVGFNGGHMANYFDTELQHNRSKIRSEGYITDYLTDRAIEFIDNCKDENFFCYLPYNAPHAPIQVPEEFYSNYKHLQSDPNDITPGVYAMCENIDYNVGRMLEYLEHEGLLDNTIVIYTTDNGPKNLRYNGDMRGCKGHLYEGGIKVPCLIYWQGRTLPVEVDATLSYIDIMPTILSMCDIEHSGDSERRVNGINFRSLLFGESQPSLGDKLRDRYLFTHKSQSDSELSDYQCVMFNSEYKLVHNYPGSYELYNKLSDASEQCDVASQYEDIVSQMRAEMDEWFEDVTVEYEHNSSHMPQVGQIDVPILIPAHEAIINGGMVHYNANKWGWAGDWLVDVSPGDKISWVVRIVSDGTYRLSVQYALEPSDDVVKASIRNLREEPVELPAFIPTQVESPDIVPRGVAYEQSWAIEPLCEVHLERGEELFQLDISSQNGAKIVKGLAVKGFLIEKI